MVTGVAAALVVFHPSEPTVTRALAALAQQTDHILVITNDSLPLPCALPERATIIDPGRNLGLGAAYNLATGWARERGASHLLLLDQDSVPAPGMVAALLEAFSRPGPIAAAGPLWRDARTGEDGFFVRGGHFGPRRYRPAAGDIVAVDFLISSGSLIALEALAAIGPFDETLFIDHVDTDWSLRARAKGYALYGVADARLDHALGEAPVSLPFGLGPLFLYPPERNYYRLRNSLLLLRRPYVPWRWALGDLGRTLALMLFYALRVPPRRQRLHAMVRAVHDALTARAPRRQIGPARRAIPLKVVSEDSLPPYRRPAALCRLLPRRGRCELIPASRHRLSQWSANGFQKAGHPAPAWWQDDPVLPARAVELFRLSNAYFFPASGAVIAADGKVMDATVEELRNCTPDRSLSPLPDVVATGGSFRFEPPPQLPRLDRAIVTMPVGAGGNYGHFVLDCLPAVVATMRVPQLARYPYVFPALTPWQRRHLELLGVTAPLLAAEPIYRASRLVFTNCMAHNLHAPNVHFRKLRDIQLANVSGGAPAEVGERIYVSRRAAQLRTFVGESELEHRLAALGFSIVQPELYPIDQQIQIFHQAKVVVGPTGAAFANVLYCRPDTLVVEIVPTAMAGLWVGWLCAFTGARWRPYYCEGRSPRTWAVQADLVFSVDQEELISFILGQIDAGVAVQKSASSLPRVHMRASEPKPH
jgi:rhamnosyltransferase